MSGPSVYKTHYMNCERDSYIIQVIFYLGYFGVTRTQCLGDPSRLHKSTQNNYIGGLFIKRKTRNALNLKTLVEIFLVTQCNKLA